MRGRGSPNTRRMTYRSKELSLLSGINTEAGQTMNLWRDIGAGGTLADIYASRQRWNSDLARFELGRISGQFAIGCALAVGSDDRTSGDLQFVCRHVETVSRG